MEIERKYLIEKLPFDLSPYKKIEITQGYISIDPVIRVRKTNERYILTIKGNGLLERDEFELPLTKKQFETLWKKTGPQIICKTRYLIPLENSLTAELDIYHEQLSPLITVEVEFESAEQAGSFTAPVWFGRNVTFEQAYQNNNLSNYGLPE